MLKNTTAQYGAIQKFLHWLMAVLIIGMLIFGYFLGNFGIAAVYNLHKLVGLLLLLLVLLRIMWICWCKRPALPKSVSRFERILAYSVEGLLYFSMLLMPIFGWMATTLAGRVPVFLGYRLNMPFIPLNPALAHQVMGLHEDLAVIIIVLIVLHVLGALKHYVIDKDGVVERMLPSSSRHSK